MRLVGRSLPAAVLVGLAAACQATSPSAVPAVTASPAPLASPAPSAVPATASAPVETLGPTLAGPILEAWQEEPVPVPPGLIPRVDQACRRNLGPDFPEGVVLVLIDARGEGLVPAYYASPAGAWVSCNDLRVDARGEVSGERGHSVSAGGLDDLGPFDIEFVDFSWAGEPPRPIIRSYLVGTAGLGVARAEIQSPGQPSIVASIANGWWATWTPGPMPARWQIVAFDTLGRQVDVVDGVTQNQDP